MFFELTEMKNEELYAVEGGGLAGFCLGYCFGTVVGAIGSIPIVVYGCVTDASAAETAEACLAVIETSAMVGGAVGAVSPV